MEGRKSSKMLVFLERQHRNPFSQADLYLVGMLLMVESFRPVDLGQTALDQSRSAHQFHPEVSGTPTSAQLGSPADPCFFLIF
jgi:hypothetical protein